MLHYATALRSNSPSQRRSAVSELRRLGITAPAAAFDFLIPILDDADVGMRDEATEVVINLARGDGREIVLSYLKDALGKDGPVRMRSLRIISRVGSEAGPLVPTLVAVLQTENPILARMTAEALCSIGSDAVAALEPLQAHPIPIVQREVKRILAKLRSG